ATAKLRRDLAVAGIRVDRTTGTGLEAASEPPTRKRKRPGSARCRRLAGNLTRWPGELRLGVHDVAGNVRRHGALRVRLPRPPQQPSALEGWDQVQVEPAGFSADQVGYVVAGTQIRACVRDPKQERCGDVWGEPEFVEGATSHGFDSAR